MREYNFCEKTQAFEHQINAIVEISGDHNVALFDEPGLGKSKMVISALCDDMNNKIIEAALVVCKKTLIRTWENEIKKHTHLNSMVLTGNTVERKKNFVIFSHFYIINYESLIAEEELIEKLLKLKRFALILDESHRIKNPDSSITKTLVRVGSIAKKKIIITGTPVANKPEDIWSQFYFLDDGKLLGRDFIKFRKKYGIQISMGRQTINEDNLKELQENIRNFSIRRTKKAVSKDLEEKVFIKIKVGMEKTQKALYEELRDKLYIEVKNMEDEIIIDSAEGIFKKLLRLTQIASNPYLVDEGYKETPDKFRKLDDLVKEIIDRGEKVIVWTSFIKNIVILKTRYKNYGALQLYGKMKIEDRNKVVEWFQDDPDHRVLIANPSAAKEGLTLTAANNAIYVDRTFNLNDFLQSQDRIHRISQKKRCNIYILISKNTVDEYIDEILTKKDTIASFIHGDTTELELPKSLLTKEKLIEILGEYKNAKRFGNKRR